MKQQLTHFPAGLVARRELPVFSWAWQSRTPTWETASAGVAGRLRAVGTATGTSDGLYRTWSGTGPLCMGGVSTTGPAGVRMAVLLGGDGPAEQAAPPILLPVNPCA
ncbi:hypothetical protein ACFQ48_07885 [Hymenobacter caeli]|uniref:Uncharacterized protein n=1 Tax=Hymenobacter caeli TaxID=2735894 RepID=A0ABX2FM04_9BACT|nr:hypothetical protein [Hymenobacter caeli]NRT18162.1 hypothetical protein [Hymenobacter caeli]